MRQRLADLAWYYRFGRQDAHRGYTERPARWTDRAIYRLGRLSATWSRR